MRGSCGGDYKCEGGWVGGESKGDGEWKGFGVKEQ